MALYFILLPIIDDLNKEKVKLD